MGGYIFFTLLAAGMVYGYLSNAPLRLALVCVIGIVTPIVSLVDGSSPADAYAHFLAAVILSTFILTPTLWLLFGIGFLLGKFGLKIPGNDR